MPRAKSSDVALRLLSTWGELESQRQTHMLATAIGFMMLCNGEQTRTITDADLRSFLASFTPSMYRTAEDDGYLVTITKNGKNDGPSDP